MGEEKWKTAITDVKPNKIVMRGYPVDELLGKISFARAIYLVLKGEFPSPEVGTLIDAIFVSSIDHGASPPSILAARTVASTGGELNSAIAAGVLAISRRRCRGRPAAFYGDREAGGRVQRRRKEGGQRRP